MVITPTGYPAWKRDTSHTNYGGHVNKTNYLSRGVIDALTDVGAEAICRMAADLEAVVRTAPFAVITYQGIDATNPPTIEKVFLQTGIRTSSYAGDEAPAGLPSAAMVAGNTVFTFAASYTDPYGVACAWAPTQAQALILGATPGIITCTVSGATVQVDTYTTLGAGYPTARVCLTVW